jgi:hypothetical protein
MKPLTIESTSFRGLWCAASRWPRRGETVVLGTNPWGQPVFFDERRENELFVEHGAQLRVLSRGMWCLCHGIPHMNHGRILTVRFEHRWRKRGTSACVLDQFDEVIRSLVSHWSSDSSMKAKGGLREKPALFLLTSTHFLCFISRRVARRYSRTLWRCPYGCADEVY